MLASIFMLKKKIPFEGNIESFEFGAVVGAGRCQHVASLLPDLVIFWD